MSGASGTTNSQGALYELVARGNKDAYFFADDPKSLFPFQNSYKPQTAFLSELRYDQASNPAAFGKTCEFEVLIVGDLVSEVAFSIDLPSWLPPTYAEANPSSIITDTSGVSYGWTNSVAYFLFERIQFYQDSLVLQEWSGDALWAIQAMSGTLSSSHLTNVEVGAHDGTPLTIGQNATPGRLRLSLPLPGCDEPSDTGFPLRSLTKHKYKIRATLRRMEDLVEASDKRSKPVPWDGRLFQIQRSRGGQVETFRTLGKTDMSPIRIQLETRQHYLLEEAKEKLLQTPIKLPFTQVYESVFTQSLVDYISVIKGGVSIIQRRIEYARHPAGRMFWFFRSRADILANRYTAVENVIDPNKSYYNSISLLIAGQSRELPRGPMVWKDLVALAKEEIDPGTEIGSMNWTRGFTNDGKTDTQPTGSINFTRADKPTLLIDLANTVAPQETELRVFVLGWAQMEIQGGRGALLSAN